LAFLPCRFLVHHYFAFIVVNKYVYKQEIIINSKNNTHQTILWAHFEAHFHIMSFSLADEDVDYDGQIWAAIRLSDGLWELFIQAQIYTYSLETHPPV